MSSNVSSKHLMLAGIGVGLAAGALAAAQSGKRPAASTPSAGKPTGTTGSGGTAAVPSLPPKATTPTTPVTPKPTPTPSPKPSTPAPAPVPSGSVVPAGPSWAGEPVAPNAPTLLDKRTDALAAFLAKAQPLYWGASPKARRKFASEIVVAAHWEKYPLDLLVAHLWAEGALKPCMTPTKGSGAYGPLQVSAITCADVGMSYPPKSVQDAITVGIRYMRRMPGYGASTLTEALRIYGLGPGNYREFLKYGCSGKPCDRGQSVWRHECSCEGANQRYTWKIREMAGKAAAANLHTLPWATWRAKV